MRIMLGIALGKRAGRGDEVINTGTLIVGENNRDANWWVMVGAAIAEFCADKAAEADGNDDSGEYRTQMNYM